MRERRRWHRVSILLGGPPSRVADDAGGKEDSAASTLAADEAGRIAQIRERRSEMGTVVISENVSLDGVIQDPAGDEGFRRGGWVGLLAGREEVAKVTLDEALGAEALLLGRRSYEWFASRWPSRTGDLADRLNSLPKYVVSSTVQDPSWNNSTVLRGDVVAEVSRLK